MPLIDVQRRMVEVGRIRAGDKGPKGEPRKLANWRLTSKDKTRLDHAAAMWGGTVDQWEQEWQLYTTVDALPIMLLPGHPPTSWYELWSKGGCQRRCDGQHELISDQACLCGDDRECKPTTRLSVLLPDIPGIGSWLLSSTGFNAAAELAGAADLLQKASAQGVLIPARLRLEQRTSTKAGQTRKFAVPVIDIDVSFRQLLGDQAPLDTQAPSVVAGGYTPIPETSSNGPTLGEALEIAETQVVTRKPKGRIPTPDLEDESAPAIDAPTSIASSQATLEDEVKIPTKAMNTKMDVMVTKLREAGRINTEKIWSVIAAARNEPVETMAERLHGRDDYGDLHWAPLRVSLTRPEASRLIDWLERHEQSQPTARGDHE